MIVSTRELVGQIIDNKYRLEHLLGQGGMGAVFRAVHLGTERPVALKILSPELVGDSVLVERFQREARAAGRLRHPHVVDVTDFGIAKGADQDIAYLVMEFLEGQTLGQFLQKNARVRLEVVVDLATQICSAMEAAHCAGIVHRDLKPDNVWLTPKGEEKHHVKVLDFGIAKLREREVVTLPDPSDPMVLAFAPTHPGKSAAHLDVSVVKTAPSVSSPIALQTEVKREDAVAGGLTQDGTFLGTPIYMSPEQSEGKPLDIRSDIYSLGIILYEMLAGAPPFSASSPLALLNAHIAEMPPPLFEKRADIPPAVAGLVMAMLEKDPDKRPGSFAKVAAMLQARSEGAGQLLRRGLNFYVLHFGSLMRLAWPIAAYNLVWAALQWWSIEGSSGIPKTIISALNTFWLVFGGILYIAAMGAIGEYIVRSETAMSSRSGRGSRAFLRRFAFAFLPSAVFWGFTQGVGPTVITRMIHAITLFWETFRTEDQGSVWTSFAAKSIEDLRFGWSYLFFVWYGSATLSFLIARKWLLVPIITWVDDAQLFAVFRRSNVLCKRDSHTLTWLIPPLLLPIFASLWVAIILVGFFVHWPSELTVRTLSEGSVLTASPIITAILAPLTVTFSTVVLALLYLHLRRWEGETEG